MPALPAEAAGHRSVWAAESVPAVGKQRMENWLCYRVTGAACPGDESAVTCSPAGGAAGGRMCVGDARRVCVDGGWMATRWDTTQRLRMKVV